MSVLRESATDLIVRAMETADDMAEVVVIYRMKDNNGADSDGFGWGEQYGRHVCAAWNVGIGKLGNAA